MPANELLAALQVNFIDYEPLRQKLAEQGPKVGFNDNRADLLLSTLFDAFAAACEGYGRTPRGGIMRPGTGLAMYYIWLARGIRECGNRSSVQQPRSG